MERRRVKGPFRDTLTVHTAPSGTQYVPLVELLFPRSELLDLARAAKRRQKRCQRGARR